jgi:hypothetical protein
VENETISATSIYCHTSAFISLWVFQIFCFNLQINCIFLSLHWQEVQKFIHYSFNTFLECLTCSSFFS